jgi:hypothetical protein
MTRRKRPILRTLMAGVLLAPSLRDPQAIPEPPAKTTPNTPTAITVYIYENDMEETPPKNENLYQKLIEEIKELLKLTEEEAQKLLKLLEQQQFEEAEKYLKAQLAKYNVTINFVIVPRPQVASTSVSPQRRTPIGTIDLGSYSTVGGKNVLFGTGYGGLELQPTDTLNSIDAKFTPDLVAPEETPLLNSQQADAVSNLFRTIEIARREKAAKDKYKGID